MAQTITSAVSAIILDLLHLGRIIYEGHTDMQHAPIAIDNVKLEIFHIRNYLQRLKDLVHMPSSPLSYFPGDSQEGLKSSLECLKSVEEQLLEALKTYLTQPARMGTIVRQFKWPWGKEKSGGKEKGGGQEKDVEKLRSELEAHKTMLSVTVALLQFLAIGKVIKMEGTLLQSASVFAVGYGTSSSLPETPTSGNEFKFDDIPDMEEVKKILQTCNRDFTFDNDQDKQEYWKNQRYKNSLAEFVISGKFDEALVRVNAQEMAAINYQHSTPSPDGYRNLSMTRTWGSVESGPPISAEYHKVNNYVASGYHINQQPVSPPLTPPPALPPVNYAGFVPPPPEDFPYSAQIPSMAHAPHPQPYGPSYSIPLQYNEWGPRTDTMYPNDPHNNNYYGSNCGPGWPPYAAAAPPPAWDPNFHVQQQPYSYYPPDSMHTYDQSGYHEWDGTSGNGYS